MSSQTPVEAAAMATVIIAVSLVAVAYVVLRLTGQERDATAIPGV